MFAFPNRESLADGQAHSKEVEFQAKFKLRKR